MTNEEHTTHTLMKIYYFLCQWEHDYTESADMSFVRKVDSLMVQFSETRPDLDERMRKLDYLATDEALEDFENKAASSSG